VTAESGRAGTRWLLPALVIGAAAGSSSLSRQAAMLVPTSFPHSPASKARWVWSGSRTVRASLHIAVLQRLTRSTVATAIVGSAAEAFRREEARRRLPAVRLQTTTEAAPGRS